MATYFNSIKNPEDMIPSMDKALLSDMTEEFPFLAGLNPANAATAMNIVYKETKQHFVVIIDEYDCIVRDAPDNKDLIIDYLKYLRGFFKTEESKKFLALGYITGILPIKKVDGESAMNNFSEYTMVSSKELTRYFGFTEGGGFRVMFRL